jgi:hypothetical protein
MRPLAIGAGVVLSLAIATGVVIAVLGLLRTEQPEPIVLQRPPAGQVRADYLPDGTPVWVIGHEDGTVDVLSGFDTHTPSNIGKLLWWCPEARGLDNPAHGSKWDEYGVKIGGPAPAGLASWEVSVVSSRVLLGETRAAPQLDAPVHGPPSHEREWCNGFAGGAIFHTFDGWERWDSPTAAVASAPSGWVLLEGSLVARGGEVRLCALDGCDDSVIAANVDPPQPGTPSAGAFGPLSEWSYIARVRDGVLTDVTRTVAP